MSFVFCFGSLGNNFFLIFADVETGSEIDRFSRGTGFKANGVDVLNDAEFWACKQQMAEQVKEGPMAVENQTVSEIRSRGAPTKGFGG